MNTRFYLKRVEWAVHGLYAELGIDPAGVTVLSQHQRFHREAHVGAALHATGQVVDIGEAELTILIRMVHSRTGELAATFVFRIASTKPWPAAVVAAAARCGGQLDDRSSPRGLAEGEGSDPAASREEAIRRGMTASMRTVILSERCDDQGRLRLWEAMALVADGMPHVQAGRWREALKTTAPTKPQRVGGALVEFAFHHRRWPMAGERVEMWSGPVSCTDKVTRAAHWLIDPETGEALATVRAVGVALDLDARKLIPLTPEAQELFYQDAAKGF